MLNRVLSCAVIVSGGTYGSPVDDRGMVAEQLGHFAVMISGRCQRGSRRRRAYCSSARPGQLPGTGPLPTCTHIEPPSPRFLITTMDPAGARWKISDTRNGTLRLFEVFDLSVRPNGPYWI